MEGTGHDRSTQQHLQQRLAALNRAIISLMGINTTDRLCEEAIRLGIETLGFDRLGLYFALPGDPPMIVATYGTDEYGNVQSEQGIIRPLSDNDWLLTPEFLEEHHCAVRVLGRLVQPRMDSELYTVGYGWNAAAGLWNGERLIGYLFADNLLRQQPYREDDGELLAAYALALGHLCTRLRVEEALRQRQLDYRALLEAIPDLFFSINREGIFLDYHRPANTYLVAGADQIIGHTVYELLPPALAQQTMHAIKQSSDTGECVTFEYHLAFGSEIRHYEARLVEATDGIILALVRDVTDRKFLEEQLIAGHKMESLGRMAGGIAHDFNNLLTVIQGFAGLAERYVEPQQPQLAKALTHITVASEKGAQLTNQLLSFARKQVIEPQLFDLGRVLSEMAGFLRQVLKDTIDLQIEPATELLPVRIARTQFEQLLVNLAANADEAMPQGGTLRIACSHSSLTPTAARRYLDARAGEYVLMEFTDSGTGIEQTIIRNIFDPFFTTKQATKHSGLGLAICHGIVQQQGGHIAVQSTAGRGTTFQIFLPYIQEQIAPTTLATELPSSRGQETLLLVEDDADVRAITQELLSDFGYTVVAFARGAEAVAYVEAQPAAFDLLITDMMMPQMNGQEVTKAIRRLRPDVPVLLVSGYLADPLHELVNLVHVDFLAKPYSTTALAGKVRALLDQAREA